MPPVRALPHFQRPGAEPGAQPIIPEIADGAAQPRLISGGRAERDSEGEVSFIRVSFRCEFIVVYFSDCEAWFRLA